MNWYKSAQIDYNSPILVQKGKGPPSSPGEVTRAIEELVSISGLSICDINSGNCDEFAYTLYDKLSGANIYEIYFYSDYPTHFFIEVGGLYYDAETPGGVVDWKSLPIYKKFFNL